VSALVAAVLGAMCGLGLLVTFAGLRGRAVLGGWGSAGRSLLPTDRLVVRLGSSVLAAALVLMSLGWPVVAGFAAIAAWVTPDAIAASGRHRREIARVEAIAAWTEQLRDTLAAANGLEHAIGASADLASGPIARPISRLAARLDYEPLGSALRGFADDVDHPLADFVVAALVIAAEREAREVGTLLGHLADSARDDARMRSRVWVGRARSRTAVRIIGVVLVVTLGVVWLADRDYLAVYGTGEGQLVMLVVGVMFAGALAAMSRMGRIALPDRFVARRSGAGS
jgi:tight adherence protein B